MQRQLYPLEQVEDSLERHLAGSSRRGQAIYLTVVAMVVVGLALLPVVRVGVSVTSRGIVRPVTEKHEVRAQASGFAEVLRLEEGARVEKGEELVTLRAGELGERLALVGVQIDQARHAVHDLELLASSPEPAELPPARFRTARYREEAARLGGELGESAIRTEQARRDAERARALATRGLAPRAQAEDAELRLSQLRAEQSVRRERFRGEWRSALAAARMELSRLRSDRAVLEEERALFRVTAPVTGTVEQVAGISPGSFVRAGESLAVISPLSDLVAEVYVTPRDIGLLQPGDPVRILVDAFNYNDWGFVTGRVSEISDDFVLVDDRPVFRVGVALDRTGLRLKNGFRGSLKKGMTLQARFMVAERTLFQLLRDDINDWLNPVHAG